MPYVMFGSIQLLCLAFLYFTYKGAFSLPFAAGVLLIMLVHSFYELVKKPDPIASRIASFTAALWLGGLLSLKLVLELRSITTSLVALLFFLVCWGIAGASTYMLARRPARIAFDE